MHANWSNTPSSEVIKRKKFLTRLLRNRCCAMPHPPIHADFKWIEFKILSGKRGL